MKKKSFGKNQDKKFLNTVELAERWSKSPRTLENWRGKNKGPNYYRIGGEVLYDLEDIEKIERESYVSIND